MSKMFESHKRTIAKTITYRITSIFITTIIVYLLTGNFLLSLGAGSLDTVVKLGMYFVHERAWNNTNWGKAK